MSLKQYNEILSKKLYSLKKEKKQVKKFKK